VQFGSRKPLGPGSHGSCSRVAVSKNRMNNHGEMRGRKGYRKYSGGKPHGEKMGERNQLIKGLVRAEMRKRGT